MNPTESLSETRVEVQIDDALAESVPADLLAHAARASLRQQGVEGPAELAIVITGDATLRRLNRTYRGIDAPTDVLAFGSERVDGFVTPSSAVRYLGDVIISLPRAEAQARDVGHSVAAELRLLTVHGVLHLLGHDHAESEEKAAMWLAQGEILRELEKLNLA